MDKGIYRLTLRLSMANVTHKKVIDVLEKISKGKRSGAVCEMILNDVKNKDLENIITTAVERAISNAGYQPIKIEEVSTNILGFLSALQQEGT